MSYLNHKKIGISLTCYKRADYLEQVLDSLYASITYANLDTFRTKLYVSIDYYDDTIPNMIRAIDWISRKFTINNPSIGCNANTKQAILMSLNDNDATIHLEDDTVLTKDGISFFIKCLQEYHDDPTIISIAGYNRTNSLENADLSEVIKQKHFTCWGCAFWKHKFDIFNNNWTQDLNRENRSSSWDTHLDQNIFQKDNINFYQIKPAISRIQNIGAIDGTWVPSESFHESNHKTPFTSDNVIN